MSIAPAYYVMLMVWLTTSHLLGHFGYELGFMKNRRPMSIACNVLFLNGLLEPCNNDVMPGGWYITADENVIKNNEFVYFHAITQMPCFLLGMKLHAKEKAEEDNMGGNVNLLKAGIFFLTDILLWFQQWELLHTI